MRIFMDETAWLALANADDPLHLLMKNEFQNFLEGGNRFYSSNIMIGNVISGIKDMQGTAKASGFYNIVEEARLGTHLHILWIGRRTMKDAFRLFNKFPDLQLSIWDFANIVLMNRRNIRFIMTANTAYSEMGFKIVPENKG